VTVLSCRAFTDPGHVHPFAPLSISTDIGHKRWFGSSEVARCNVGRRAEIGRAGSVPALLPHLGYRRHREVFCPPLGPRPPSQGV